MGMLKGLVGCASLLMFVMPSLLQAKSIADGNRYICETIEAVGWKANGKFTDLDITNPETQYIIEPEVENFKIPKSSKEGFSDHVSTHSISLIGADKRLALCDATSFFNFTLSCYSPHSVYEDGAVFSIPMFFIALNEDGRGTFAKNLTTTAIYANSFQGGTLGLPALEVGKCKQF